MGEDITRRRDRSKRRWTDVVKDNEDRSNRTLVESSRSARDRQQWRTSYITRGVRWSPTVRN